MKKPTLFRLFFFLVTLTGCQPSNNEGLPAPKWHWYKGNTHAHTTICGHADTSPKRVARWYLDNGYHFLILSEHNHFINPDTVPLPADRRPDFILIPGEEVSGDQDIHTTAMNVYGYVDPGGVLPTKTEVIQSHVDSTRAQRGIPILNHPNYISGAHAADILPVERLHLFELYNGHPLVYNWGREEKYHHVSTEAKWDSLLSAGLRIYGVSSDDAHIFQAWAEENSNPGRGWVMVRSDTLSAEAITSAMAAGDFYASSGVMLEEVLISPEEYFLTIDTAATSRELASPFLIGRPVDAAAEGFTIEFFGSQGRTLYQISSPSLRTAAYEPQKDDGYVRARVTCRRRVDGKVQEYYAWTQPLFLD